MDNIFVDEKKIYANIPRYKRKEHLLKIRPNLRWNQDVPSNLGRHLFVASKFSGSQSVLNLTLKLLELFREVRLEMAEVRRHLFSLL